MEPCHCEHGFTCNQKCGLDYLDCIRLHYYSNCDHQWNGEVVKIPNGESVTCSKCGELAIMHDCINGP